MLGLAAADVIMVVGANLTESHPVLALEVVKALRAGKKIIVIDPRRTEIAAKASIHIAVKPGTDLAALRAMMRNVLDMGLVDGDFVDSQTQNFDSLKSTLQGLQLEVEAGTCGVDDRTTQGGSGRLRRSGRGDDHHRYWCGSRCKGRGHRVGAWLVCL